MAWPLWPGRYCGRSVIPVATVGKVGGGIPTTRLVGGRYPADEPDTAPYPIGRDGEDQESDPEDEPGA